MANTDEKPAGLIYPPTDVKTIVDKTAEHVARSGEAFQQLIREKYEGNARFSFIYPNDPYYPYYEYMVHQFKSGKIGAANDAKSDVVPPSDAMETDTVDRIDGGDTSEGNGPQKPESQRFVSAMPAVSAQDLDVIKLTAQFVARNGHQFMTGLAQREASNYQFDFLSPSHSLFGYFRQLVDQYTLVFSPPEDLKERVQNDIRDKYQILERAKHRMEWIAFEKEERKQKTKEAEREKEAFLSVDWHDFAIVGAVEFVEEDAHIDLPPPLRLQDLKSMSLADKHKASLGGAPGAPVSVAGARVPAATVTTASAAPHVKPVPQVTDGRGDDDDDDDVEMDMEDDDDSDDIDAELEAERRSTTIQPLPSALGAGPMKIRKDYVPNLRRGPQIAKVMLRCQLCELEIPTDEFEEHIRVELIDPRWKEQRLVYERKIRDSNLIREGVDIAHFLKQLAEHRSDGSGMEKTDSETATGSKGSGSSKVVWDGHSSSAGLATRRARENITAEEHTAEMYRKRGMADPRDPSLNIGPQLPHPAAKRRKH